MKNKDDIMGLLRAHKQEMVEHFGVNRIGLFGSYAHGGAGRSSDIDIMVEFTEPTFDHYMDLKFFLERLLGADVDLILSDTLKPRIRPYIEDDLIYA